MATIKSNVATAQTITFGGKLITTDLGGRVRLAHGDLTIDSAYGSGTIIELAKLPAGARVLPQSQLHFEAGQNASLAVKVGDAADDDRYFAGTVGSSAISISLNANRLNNYVTTKEDMVFVTTTAQALTANKKIAFDLLYVVD